ncbi:hypothetical protein BVC80_3g19 [Macleaya cordata]|uniref:Zinc finger protein n=1 Tax=Macleaya cordata TaxID=56857 RepID=A0A200QXL0_MACCD|nr:hypothetical protein BVC80_3g19 [Macleaya cordata]
MAKKFCSSSNMKWDFEICQLCEQPSHTAMSCPWMYSKCMIRGCIGLRMLLSCDNNISKGKKYLKCQFPDCDGFIWLEDAIKEGQGAQVGGTFQPLIQSKTQERSILCVTNVVALNGFVMPLRSMRAPLSKNNS